MLFRSKLPKTVKLAAYGVAYTVVVGVFVLFIPISFGMTGSSEQYKYLNWLVSRYNASSHSIFTEHTLTLP